MKFFPNKKILIQWCSGKWWPLYLVVWFYFAYLAFSVVIGQHNLALYPFYLVNFGVHEMAHVATGGLPDMLSAIAGSAAEILLAGLFIIAGLSTKSYFATSMMGVWVMFSFYEVGIYMADARALELDLVSVASATGAAAPSETIHDWNFILGELGWLESDVIIGNMTKGIGFMIGVSGLAIGVWMILQMLSKSSQAQTAKPIGGSAEEKTSDLIREVKNSQSFVQDSDKMALEALEVDDDDNRKD